MGIVPTPTGGGYWIPDERGNTFALGDAAAIATVAGLPEGDHVVAAAVRPQGDGTWVVSVPPRPQAPRG